MGLSFLGQGPGSGGRTAAGFDHLQGFKAGVRRALDAATGRLERTDGADGFPA